METKAMSEDDYTKKANELDRLLNDPDVPMEPSMIWLLVDELLAAGGPERGKQADVSGRPRR
jgi:hypothetical protein